MLQGAGYGDNARAAFLTKSLEEMKAFIVNKGGIAETAYSLAGLGDLLLTATSSFHSELNRRSAQARGKP